MNIVEVKNLTKTFVQGYTEIKAVDNVSLEVAEGEMLAITGQSGSGKTTLLNLIGGIEEAAEGDIFIDGTDITIADKDELAQIRRQKIGYVFQEFNLIPILTVKENIIMPLLLDSKKVDKKRFDEIVSYLGLEERLDHLPSQLSGGQKQLVAIARALINSPKIILADEPTGNLDRKMADEIMALLLDLNKKGITILLVTHEERYGDMCKRKIVMRDGKVHCEQSLTAIFSARNGVIIETHEFIPYYMGFKNFKLLADIRHKIIDDDIRRSIELVGLDPKLKKSVKKYSLGMRQRLGHAQAIMESPDLLILDGPMNGLDKDGVDEMRKYLLDLKAQGKTILIASHSAEDIDVLCDTVVEMDKGKMDGGEVNPLMKSNDNINTLTD